MRNKTGQLLLHVTGCIAFLSLPVLLSPDVSWNFRFVTLHSFQEDFISYALLLLFFYLNYFLYLPNFWFRQKIFFYAVCIVVSYAVIAFLPHIIIPGNHRYPGPIGMMRYQQPANPSEYRADPQSMPSNGLPPWRQDLQPRFDGDSSGLPPAAYDSLPSPATQQPPEYHLKSRSNPPPFKDRFFLWHLPHFEYLFQFVMVLVLSAMIRINNRLKQSEKEKVNAELSYLKAQINPHFLFNTLNSIYSSAISENADNTASAVVKLSGMMRYVISEAHHQFVSLKKELEYISDYIELQKIRLGNTVDLQYNVSGNADGKQIAPLILISFIENAFKHGVNPEENARIEIEIIIHGQTLHLSVLNNKVKTTNTDHLKNNVGIENTTNRLGLVYPSRHELVIKNEDKDFLVLLKINL